jgi:hypothetical protein
MREFLFNEDSSQIYGLINKELGGYYNKLINKIKKDLRIISSEFIEAARA